MFITYICFCMLFLCNDIHAFLLFTCKRVFYHENCYISFCVCYVLFIYKMLFNYTSVPICGTFYCILFVPLLSLHHTQNNKKERESMCVSKFVICMYHVDDFLNCLFSLIKLKVWDIWCEIKNEKHCKTHFDRTSLSSDSSICYCHKDRN